jgi:hypothetical protein
MRIAVTAAEHFTDRQATNARQNTNQISPDSNNRQTPVTPEVNRRLPQPYPPFGSHPTNTANKELNSSKDKRRNQKGIRTNQEEGNQEQGML